MNDEPKPVTGETPTDAPSSKPSAVLSTLSRFAWPVIGLAVAGFAIWLLVRELRALSFADIGASLARVPVANWFGAFASAALAYAALAGYDRIALRHLGHKLSWPFIAIASFTSYALSHNLGASVFSGAVVRYRAYSSKGLSAADVGVLVALTAFNFALGVMILGGFILIARPDLGQRFLDMPSWLAVTAGVGMLAAVAFYVIGSLLHLKPLVIRGFALLYPRPPIVLRQLIVGPMELLGAAGIVYFCLPAEGNPGYVIILGIFLASFSLAVASHAPGGLGVLEFLFVSGLRDMNPADVLAALIIFRFFYLVLPLTISIVVVLLFERQQLVARRRSG